jgi:hypothetical protein
MGWKGSKEKTTTRPMTVCALADMEYPDRWARGMPMLTPAMERRRARIWEGSW